MEKIYAIKQVLQCYLSKEENKRQIRVFHRLFLIFVLNINVNKSDEI